MIYDLSVSNITTTEKKANLQLNTPTQCTCTLFTSLALENLIQLSLDQCDELVNTRDSDLHIFGEFLFTPLLRTTLGDSEIVSCFVMGIQSLFAADILYLVLR